MAATKDIGKLVVKMQLDLAELKADAAKSNAIMKKAAQSWQSDIKAASVGIKEVFAGSFLSGAVQQAISSITAGITAMFDKFDQLADSADKLNTTTETLQEIGFAASQTGVDLGEAEKALAKLQVNLGKIGTGEGKAAAKALADLKLSANALRSMEAGDALEAIGNALKDLPDQTSRMAAATALLGKGATELLPLVTQFGELRDKARALGAVIDEQTVRAAADFVDQTEILKIQGTALLAEFLRPLIPVLSQAAVEMGGVADSAGKAGSGMAGAKSDAAELGKALADLIRWGNKADEVLTDVYKAVVANGRSVRETLQHGTAKNLGPGRDAEYHDFQEKKKTAQELEAIQKRQAEFAAQWERDTLAQLARDRKRREEAERMRKEGEAAAAKAAADAAKEAAAREKAAQAAESQRAAEERLRKERELTKKLLEDAIADEDKLREARDKSVQRLADSERLLAGVTQDRIDLDNAANDTYSRETIVNNQRAESNENLAKSLDEMAQFARDAFDAQTGGAEAAAVSLSLLNKLYEDGRITLEQYDAATKELGINQKKLTAEQEEYANVIGQGFGEIFGAIITGAEDAEEAIKRLLIQLAAMAAQKAATKWIDAAFANAKGNAFGANGVEAFAQGGIVTRATPFRFAGGRMGVMGEAGPEGVLPLKRGANGKLGVQAVGGGMNVTVINNAGVNVTPSQDDPSNLRITLDQVTAAMSAQIARGGNPLSSALERAYGVKR